MGDRNIFAKNKDFFRAMFHFNDRPMTQGDLTCKHIAEAVGHVKELYSATEHPFKRVEIFFCKPHDKNSVELQHVLSMFTNQKTIHSK